MGFFDDLGDKAEEYKHKLRQRFGLDPEDGETKDITLKDGRMERHVQLPNGSTARAGWRSPTPPQDAEAWLRDEKDALGRPVSVFRDKAGQEQTLLWGEPKIEAGADGASTVEYPPDTEMTIDFVRPAAQTRMGLDVSEPAQQPSKFDMARKQPDEPKGLTIDGVTTDPSNPQQSLERLTPGPQPQERNFTPGPQPQERNFTPGPVQPPKPQVTEPPAERRLAKVAPAAQQTNNSALEELLKKYGAGERPGNRAKYYAALKGMATAFDPVLQMKSDTSYYDQGIKEENDKQTDWRERVKNEMKLRFDENQRLAKDQATRDAFNLAEAGRNTRAQNTIDAISGRQDKSLGVKVEENQKNRELAADALGVKGATRAAENMPKESTLQAAEKVEKLLQSGKPIPGFGAIINSLRRLPPGEFAKGVGSAIANASMSPQEQAEYRQVWGLTLASIFEDAGKALTANEMQLKLEQLGVAAGQGPEAQRDALMSLITDVRAKAKRAYGPISPKAKQILENSGVLTPELRRALELDETLDPSEFQ